ncbi:hypothetical protein [Peribacillus deserti]|uniref:Uncharacterized protein n=1 Tax=Peribacillus deserti TaxID=673318 RepID=A0A2N5M1E2_9BACI|nr:hypothetical protein [Peribacillus deserti]PLT28204.1 hypothetical protein CUU66_19875 [Peribacillus deserti]
MEYEEFQNRINEFKQLEMTIPRYYEYIDDDIELTPNDIASIFQKDVKRVRCWFNPGLKHGALPSIDPTRHRCTGRQLKEWLFKRDLRSLMKDKKFMELR